MQLAFCCGGHNWNDKRRRSWHSGTMKYLLVCDRLRMNFSSLCTHLWASLLIINAVFPYFLNFFKDHKRITTLQLTYFVQDHKKITSYTKINYRHQFFLNFLLARSFKLPVKFICQLQLVLSFLHNLASILLQLFNTINHCNFVKISNLVTDHSKVDVQTLVEHSSC